MDDEVFEVDDLLSVKVAASLENAIPAGAVLMVQTMSEEGHGFRFIRSHNMSTWIALGMLRSATLYVEQQDLDAWDDGE